MIERERTGEQEGFNLLLKEIPLKDCSYEYNFVTEEWSWKAPKDKIFRVTGQFTIFCNQSDYFDYSHMPEMSAEMLMNEYPEKYSEFLKETNGNKKKALKLLNEDTFDMEGLGMPPNFFDGKWLVIPSELEETSLLIKSDIKFKYDEDCFQIIEDISPKSEIETGCLFDSTTKAIHWKQFYTEAVFNKNKIKLVDFIEKKELLIFESNKSKQIETPERVLSRKRKDENQEKDLKNFCQDNENLIFDKLPPWCEDLLIARKKDKIIFPEEKEKKPLKENEPEDDF